MTLLSNLHLKWTPLLLTKMLETQISQVAQQVATSSQTPGVFPSQTETTPKAV